MRSGVSSRIRDCRFHDNTGYGVYAITGSVLSHCTADNNEGGGIVTFVNCTIFQCTAWGNQHVGIDAGSGSTIRECVASNNQGIDGIHGHGGTTIIGCSAKGNLGTNSNFGSYGIRADDNCVIKDCTAWYNNHSVSPSTSSQGVGIDVGKGCLVRDCSVTFNRGDGIRADSDGYLSGNICANNGHGVDAFGAGIHILGADNRIEANTVTENNNGIDVDEPGNLIIRNSASGNRSNYSIVPGNTDAQVLSPGSSFVVTNPWANFSF